MTGPDAPLRIVSVFPDLLGTYGDGGNVRVLAQRLTMRGIPVDVVTVPLTDEVPADGQLYVIGGGEDDAQVQALRAMQASPLVDAAQGGAHVLAVCAGMQLLGTAFTGADGVRHEGLGLLDVETTRLPKRVVGDVVGRFDESFGLPALNGFANHGGGTRLGAAARPLATVTKGLGNDGTAGSAEGAVQGTVVASYLHGPLLARNPAFADWLLERALGRALPPLPAGPPEALHAERVARG